MNIVNIIVVRKKNGPAKFCCETDLPSPIWPYDGNLWVYFDCADELISDYIEDWFPRLNVDIIETN